MLHVTEIRSIDDLLNHRLTWNALLGQTPGANFCHTLDWLTVYATHLLNRDALRVLLVRDENRQAVGILPLVLKTNGKGDAHSKILTYPRASWGSFSGPIGPNPTLTLGVCLGYLAERSDEWDLIDLDGVQFDDIDRGRTATAFAFAGLAARKQVSAWVPRIDLGFGWRTYWSGRASDWRANMDSYEEQLSHQGAIRHVRHRPNGAACGEFNPRWDLYDAYLSLAATANPSLFGSRCDEAFWRALHEAAARAGALDLNLLYVNDRPAAFVYAWHYHDTVTIVSGGGDKAFGDLASHLLIRRVLEDSGSRGDRCVVLGFQSRPEFKPWQTDFAACHHYTHYRPAAPKAQWLRFKDWFASRGTHVPA